MSEPEAESRVGPGSYPLAVLACAAWLVPYIMLVAVLIYYFIDPVHNFVERQQGIVYYICAMGVGLVYLAIVVIGGSVTREIWRRIAGTPDEPVAEPAAVEEGFCPKCGYEDKWDGKKCGHCGYTYSPWKKGTTLHESD